MRVLPRVYVIGFGITLFLASLLNSSTAYAYTVGDLPLNRSWYNNAEIAHGISVIMRAVRNLALAERFGLPIHGAGIIAWG